MTKAYLDDLIVDEISLVDSPANEEARVVIFKADMMSMKCPKCGTDVQMADGKMPEKCPKCGADMEMKKSASDAKTGGDMPDEDKVTVEKLQSALQVAREELGKETEAKLAAEAELERVSKELSIARMNPEQRKAHEMAQLPEGVRKQLEAQENEIQILKDQRDAAVWDRRVRALGMDALKFGPVFKRLSGGAATEDDLMMLETHIKALNEQVRQGKLFSTLGAGGYEMGASATPRAQAMARVIAKEREIPFEDALAEVFKQNPQLYEEYRAESGGAS